MKYISNNTGIIFFFNGKPLKVEKGSSQYARIIKAFDLPEQDQEEAISEILNQKSGVFAQDGFHVSPENVFYKEDRLPTVLANKVRSLIEEGLPISIFAKFWDNLKKNPSSSSVRELYDFLAYKELPITEDGCFLAYKGLQSDFWSISGNINTKVIKGKVDSQGRIFNGVGEEIEVERYMVDDNREHHCSFGLHAGSLDYARGFSRGKLVVVKINPKDVVSVPTDYDCQKCRVTAYTVVSEFVLDERITDHQEELNCHIPCATDEYGHEILSEEKQERNDFVERVSNYLEKKRLQGSIQVPIKKIQNAFSPEYPCRMRIKDAVEDLGFHWTLDEKGGMIVQLR